MDALIIIFGGLLAIGGFFAVFSSAKITTRDHLTFLDEYRLDTVGDHFNVYSRSLKWGGDWQYKHSFLHKENAINWIEKDKKFNERLNQTHLRLKDEEANKTSEYL